MTQAAVKLSLRQTEILVYLRYQARTAKHLMARFDLSSAAIYFYLEGWEQAGYVEASERRDEGLWAIAEDGRQYLDSLPTPTPHRLWGSMTTERSFVPPWTYIRAGAGRAYELPSRGFA